MKEKITLYIFSACIIIAIGILAFEVKNKQTIELPGEGWKKDLVCSNWGSLYELNNSDFNCKLSSCERVTTVPTDVDKCSCESNNHTIYRYCVDKIARSE